MLLVDESPSKCRVVRRLRGNFTTPACCRKLRRLCYIRLTPPWRPTGHIRLVYPSRRNGRGHGLIRRARVSHGQMYRQRVIAVSGILYSWESIPSCQVPLINRPLANITCIDE
jgi:hypothetical protein